MYFVCILTYAINNIIPVVFKKLLKKKKEEIKKTFKKLLNGLECKNTNWRM